VLSTRFNQARTALTILGNIMESPSEQEEGQHYIQHSTLRGLIEFDNVSFSYPGRDDQALRSISFHIKAGEKVGVIGRIGSGKTTLEKLILGLYQPDDGAVLIDGVDTRQIDPAELRRSIGFVPQDALLFYGTLRENIALGAPFADDRMIVAAAELAGISEFVGAHPRGFDMLIGERGESLSGGQRQEVAIARAVLMDPPVLFFDEPTSAMDFTTEAAFKERLRRFAAHKTMVIVTHRSSLIDLATRMIVVDDGRIVADGPREKVVQALQSGRIGRAQ
jgi:ATP-binding cassette subfamily C protein LapB